MGDVNHALACGPQAFETPLANLGQYPAVVVANASLQPGYSHRIAPTPVADAYIGVWVQGPEGSQDIYYRIFERLALPE